MFLNKTPLCGNLTIMHKPVVAIIGRPNVGKSTLFNRIVGRPIAIVEDIPGVTRDRNYANASWLDKEFVLIDTGGFEPAATDNILQLVKKQTEMAISEADVIIFLMDGKEGLSPIDEEIGAYLRRIEKPVIYAVNKIDSLKREALLPEFYSLGVEKIVPVSAEHGLGIDDLLDEACGYISKTEKGIKDEADAAIPKVAIVGRPNVGKSTLVNTLIGKDRMIISEVPGTTRDSIDTIVRYNKKDYLLIDTAGIRKKAKIAEDVEWYSTLRSFRSIDRCDIAILIIDGFEGITDQDLKIAGYIRDAGKGCIVAVNKWDKVEKDAKTADLYTKAINRRLHFMNYAPIVYLSAQTKQRVAKIYPLIDEVLSEYSKRITTGDINRVFESIKISHAHPMYRGREVKFFYITQVSIKPPAFVIFCNYPEAVSEDYLRYIENRLREAFVFKGTTIKIFLRKKR